MRPQRHAIQPTTRGWIPVAPQDEIDSRQTVSNRTSVASLCDEVNSRGPSCLRSDYSTPSIPRGLCAASNPTGALGRCLAAACGDHITTRAQWAGCSRRTRPGSRGPAPRRYGSRLPLRRPELGSQQVNLRRTAPRIVSLVVDAANAFRGSMTPVSRPSSQALAQTDCTAPGTSSHSLG